MRKSQLKTIAKTALRSARYGMYYTNFTPMPFRIYADLTDRCNFRCPTCSKWRVKPGNEMDTLKWREIFSSLKNRTLTRRISFAGGEATLRNDLCDLIGYAKAADLNVTVVTNGFLLSERMLGNFETAGLDGLVISLNGIKRETHDPTRGVEGSFDRIQSLLPELHRFNLEINLETIVMGTNLNELIPLAELVREHGLYGIHYQALAGVNAHYALVSKKMPEVEDNWQDEDRFWIKDPFNASRVIHRLIDLQKRGYPILNPTNQLRRMIQYYQKPENIQDMKCLGGVSSLYIDPYGDVRVCYGFEPVGNAIETDPIKLWRSPKATAIRRKIKQCDKMCRLLNNNY